MELKILTPTAELVHSTSCTSVSVPGELGRMQILPGHTKLLSLVRPGIANFTDKSGETKQFRVAAGHVEVVGDSVTLAVDFAENV